MRRQDSFAAFEECLYHCVNQKVDFVLQAGDLFHDLIPSQECMLDTMKILAKYVFGNRPATYNVQNIEKCNMFSEHLKIALPIFSMHGNHDSPINCPTKENSSPLELLNIANFLNYIGIVEKTETKIIVEPVLFIKGKTKIAVYALGYMKDIALKRYFEDPNKSVVFVEPHMVENKDQNNHNKKNYKA